MAASAGTARSVDRLVSLSTNKRSSSAAAWEYAQYLFYRRAGVG